MGISEIVEDYMPLCAVRGHEEVYIRAMGERLSQCGETDIQRLFSVCRLRGKDAKKKILVLAYASTPGFLVGEIKDNGYVRMIPVDGLGNRTPLTWIEPFVPVEAETFSKRVTMYGEETIDAVVPAPPVHYQTSVGKLAKADGLYAVSGYTKERLERCLYMGDAITYTPYLQRVLNGNFFAPFLEYRIAPAALIALAERIKESELACDVSIAVTGGSDFSGAVRVAELEAPDEIIVLTAVPVQSYKGGGTSDEPGVIQCFGSAVNYEYSEKLEQYFRDKGVNCRRVASLVNTNTPTDECTYLGRGIPTAMFAVPVKYTSTSVSMVNGPAAEYLVDALGSYVSGKGAYDLRLQYRWDSPQGKDRREGRQKDSAIRS